VLDPETNLVEKTVQVGTEQSQITTFVITKDQKYLITGDSKGNLAVYLFDGFVRLISFVGIKSAISSICYDALRKRIAYSAVNGEVRIINLNEYPLKTFWYCGRKEVLNKHIDFNNADLTNVTFDKEQQIDSISNKYIGKPLYV
jgi:hypothetical protein